MIKSTYSEKHVAEVIRKIEEKTGQKYEIPEMFICPITQTVMAYPVSTSDGHVYERTEITKWLAAHDTSPLTNATLENKKLIDSIPIRSGIREVFGDPQETLNSSSVLRCQGPS